jgi:hypothetical protein
MRVLCYQQGGGSQSGLEISGSPANWPCLLLEKLGNVKLLDEDWRTAPNHGGHFWLFSGGSLATNSCDSVGWLLP